MNPKYRSKRDFYKAEMEKERRNAEFFQNSFEKMKKEKEEKEQKSKKRWSAIVYCTNCLEVNAVSIAPGVKISDGDCITCRVRGCQLLVRKVNCDRS